MRRRLKMALAVAAAATLVSVATSSGRFGSPPHAARYAEVQGRRVRYVRAGHGDAVVLVHGYGESLVSWRGVFDRIAGHHDVVALDLPGFGLSSKLEGGYQTDSLADDLSVFLYGLGIRRAVLVGHSLGGAVVAAAAIRAPGLARALILVDPALVGTPVVVPAIADSLAAGGAVRSTIAEYEALRTRFSAPHDRGWLAEPESDLAYLPAGDPAYRRVLNTVLTEFDFDYLSGARRRQLDLPVLVLWGEFDPVFPLAAGEALARSLPDARLEVIARSWHRPQVERPGETGDAIMTFLGGLRPDTGRGTPRPGP